MMNSARLTEYSDTSRDAILNFLTSKLYTGGGAHSVFNKTIGAGLAYSNGIGSNPSSGLISYYAERTPELPQTLRFAIGEVKRPMSDPLAKVKGWFTGGGLLWPVLSLAALLAFNLAYQPAFFRVVIQDGHLYGTLVDVLNQGSKVMLLALGMTLVIATGGVDYYDGKDGRFVGERLLWTGSVADIFLQAQFPLHSGRILGLPGRILISLLGVVVAMLSVTGVYIWWKKHRARKVVATRVAVPAANVCIK